MPISLAPFRRAAQAAMVDRCRITDPPPGEGTLDRGSMTVTVADGDLIYEGPCQVSTRAASREALTGGREQIHVDELTLSVPAWVALLAVGQMVTLTETTTVGDEWRDWQITRLPVSSMPITRTAVLRRTVAAPTPGGPAPA